MSIFDKCELCGSTERIFRRYSEEYRKKLYLCPECRKKCKTTDIENKLVNVKTVDGFKGWSSEDLSEAFWIHLGKYQKRPNRYSLNIMIRALLWAAHADHGLSNSFSNALEWCNIDWGKERKRTDLPEK